MRLRILPVVVAGLIAVGCASSPQDEAADKPEGPQSSVAGKSPAPDPDGEVSDKGKMIVTYQDAQTPEAINGRKLLQDNHVLDDLADDINQTLKLPHDIALHGSQCDQANAFWSANDNTITICYEEIDLGQKIFTTAGDADPIASAVNAEYATFYHEVGHMTITIYNLPITGREEDVADQASAFILLTPGEDGKIDPASVQAVKDFARSFAASAAARKELDADDLADVHSLDEQRVYNLQCWIYGSNPAANADMVGNGQLPEDRAQGCPEEWAQLERSFSTLLDPYFR